jgi:hypothetical protein
VILTYIIISPLLGVVNVIEHPSTTPRIVPEFVPSHSATVIVAGHVAGS